LYLNIWTPATSAKDSLAVLVFIHGGAFTEGSGSIAVYDGEELAKKGIIVVNINYRLGVFGFFTHPELTAESSNKACGNYALLDCIAALKWINNNITAFGGDPARVSISGQSAGAAIVHALTASPLAKGLFSSAMAISGSSLGRFNARVMADAEKSGVEFAVQKGVEDIAALRQLDAAALITRVAGDNPIRFGIVADGYVLPENLKDIFEKGKQNDVPTLTGITADDAGALNRKVTRREFTENAKRAFGDKAGSFLALYPATTDGEAAGNAVQAARDMNKIETFKWAAFRAKTAATPVYTYYFDRAIPWPEHPEFGAFHSGDLPYYFLTLKQFDRPWTSVDTLVAETASSYWVNFVKTGNPNGAGLPEWPTFDSDKKVTFRLGEKPEVMPLADEKKMEFYLGF
ncbi:MAG: carboxylesterase family protein, partial [Bacteroidales bacterium]|nr:carboxylesterase family protein [Bacteroidales bacterium]